MHIEPGQNIPFTLGQLFTEWGQPLTTSQVGPTQTTAGEQVGQASRLTGREPTVPAPPVVSVA